MITNERQHRITKAKAERFRSSFEELSQRTDEADILEVAQRDALRSQLEDLEADISAYETLRSGAKKTVEVDSLDDLPTVLVQARTAAGLSQRELAELLGLKEQQIQRYEATSYRSVSLDRLLKIVRVLGIEIPREIILNADRDSLDRALRRAAKAGLPKELVLGSLLPRSMVLELSESEYHPGVLGYLARSLEKVYGWSIDTLLGSGDLKLPNMAFSGLAYKAPKNASEKKLAAYTVYAHYLALVALETTKSPRQSLPNTPASFRRLLELQYGTVSFESALRAAWEHGLPVLPLRDKGAFHGACWRANGRSVVVLKQNVQSTARWLFDLVHELRHTQQHMDETSYSVVESGSPGATSTDDDEVDANRFAGDVVLGGRAEALAEMSVERASGEIRYLKSAVTQVAMSENVEVAQLANYMAFRLALQGENWWGTAANLQACDDSPWEIARDIFLEYADFSRLGRSDRDILSRALEY